MVDIVACLVGVRISGCDSSVKQSFFLTLLRCLRTNGQTDTTLIIVKTLNKVSVKNGLEKKLIYMLH